MKRFLRGLDPYAAMQMKLTKPRNFQELIDTTITWENDYKLVQMSRMKRAKTEAKRVQPTRSTPNLSFKPRVRTEEFHPTERRSHQKIRSSVTTVDFQDISRVSV
jgi:hypothetical protein